MADIYFYKSITGQIYNFRDDRVDNISGILPATAAPLMDGTAAVGTSIKYAREDHVHPADTNKVDKEAGKGLSTNDFTTAEKNKLAGIASGAEVNVQSDWNVSNSSSDAYIKNKPTIPTETSQLTNDSNFVSDANYVHTDNNFTTALKNKLNGIAAGAEVNVQSDWDQTDTAADDYIKNKPSLLALGETSTTAYRGDRGKTAYTHATDSARLTTATASGLYKVASTAQGHIASLTAVTKADITGLGIPAQDTTYSEATSSAYGLVKIGYTASGKNYPVQLSSGKMYVNVPWTDTTYTPASATPNNIGTAAVGTSVKYAREDHVHAISLATGDSNGQVKIAGTNVSVKGLAALAYKASLTASDVGALPSTTKYAGSDSVGGTANSAYALTHKTLTSTTLDNTAGTFAFSGSGEPWAGTDWVGVQIGDSSDKFQLTVNGGNLLVRQNDSGGTNSANWSDWKTLTPVRVKGNAETSYRTGDVNLTPANIGALALSGGTMTGDITLNSSSVNIIQKLNDTSNYGSAILWDKATPYTKAYRPQIGFHNTNEAICILPYETDSTPYSGDVGLYIRSSSYMKFAGNYVGRFTENPTTGQVVVTDGTTGGIKSSGFTIAKSVPSDAVFTDTKNTAGSTNSSSKLFLVGATSQAANPQTYSHDTAYVGTDGCLYSNSTKVKTTQTAKDSPSASGTGIAYIATVSQDANGVITATKSTVRSASASQSGVMSSTHYSKLEGIESGAQVNTITGVKGNAESSYRTGNVNLTAANIGAKATQTAVADPSASGTSATFIATLSQNTQGVISLTKKTVRSATASQSGLMSAADKEKLDLMSGMVNYKNYDNGGQSTITMTNNVCMIVFERDAGRYGIYLCSYWTSTVTKIAGTQTSVTTDGNVKISKPSGESNYIYLDNTTGSAVAVTIIGGYVSDYEVV